MVLLVAYDLHAPGRSYNPVARLLQQANSWVHPQGSVWLIDTEQNPEVWRDALKRTGDLNDEFFVVRLNPTPAWASYNFDRTAVTWLNDSRRRW